MSITWFLMVDFAPAIIASLAPAKLLILRRFDLACTGHD
jgi:hypothetical protein